MKRPASVKIGPHVYTIVWGGKDAKRNIASAKPKAELGVIDTHLHKIWLATERMSVAKQREILVHEILHGCYSLSGEPDLKGKPGHIEETIVAPTASALLGVLQDNPDLVKWVMSV